MYRVAGEFNNRGTTHYRLAHHHRRSATQSTIAHESTFHGVVRGFECAERSSRENQEKGRRKLAHSATLPLLFHRFRCAAPAIVSQHALREVHLVARSPLSLSVDYRLTLEFVVLSFDLSYYFNQLFVLYSATIPSVVRRRVHWLLHARRGIVRTRRRIRIPCWGLWRRGYGAGQHCLNRRQRRDQIVGRHTDRRHHRRTGTH
jgi:hypothetical protein